MRNGEVHGINYLFMSKSDFQAMIKSDELLEWAEVYGNYYGTPSSYVQKMLDDGKEVVLEIDTQGAMQVKARFPQGVYIYILPPSLEELAKRIKKRGTDSMEVINKRLGCVQEELKVLPNYDYAVINDRLEQAVEKVAAIITAERCKVNNLQDFAAFLSK
jgi:guanylate kinase